ncbi:MAG: hypothetical protein F6K47_13450 [Symploca sp. SIO2E6]|nr:hypothetical protein [Symploca sp. SIO2E6]
MGNHQYMSSVKRIVCLANSWKMKERCIAGIDIDTGKWVRPVCDNQYPADGRVPKYVRLIANREPQLLDILEIPLADTGKDFGFECENLSVLPSRWRCLGKARATDLLSYCQQFPQILHNSLKYVNPSYLKNLQFHQRRTLQLIHVVSFFVEKKTNYKGNPEWRGTLQTANYQHLRYAKITDPVFVEKLEAGYQPPNNCLVTVSLSIPWAPPNWEGEDPCWKLIAGVIDI